MRMCKGFQRALKGNLRENGQSHGYGKQKGCQMSGKMSSFMKVCVSALFFSLFGMLIVVIQHCKLNGAVQGLVQCDGLRKLTL